MRKSLGQPDPFRQRYKAEISSAVNEVVKGRKNKREATALIREKAMVTVHFDEIVRFLEVVETELISLHEGNIARHKLRPQEYRQWKEGWR